MKIFLLASTLAMAVAARADEAATVTAAPPTTTLAPAEPPGPNYVSGAGDLVWANQNPRPAASVGLGMNFFAGPLAGDSGDTMVHGKLALRVAPIKYLDVGLGFLYGYNHNSFNNTTGNSVTLGFDVFPSVRVGFDLGAFSVGGALLGRLRSDVHNGGPNLSATSVEVRALGDWRLLENLTLHANVGVVSDNSNALLLPTDMPSEAYRDSAQISKATALISLGAGADYVLNKYLRPYLTAYTALPAAGAKVGGTTVKLTPGLRATFFKGFFVDAQAVFGFGAGGDSGVPANPLYQVQLMVSYSFWPGLRETVVVEGPTISGKVVSKADGGPVEGAIVTTDDPSIPAAATNARGQFKLSHLPAGVERTLKVALRGYATAVERATPDKEPVTVILEPRDEPATLSGAVTDLDGKPIEQLMVYLRDPRTRKSTKVPGQPGGHWQTTVAGGTYQVTVEAPGFLSIGRKLTVTPGGSAAFDAALRPRPEVAGASLEENRITVTQRINFATGTDVIDLESQLVLEEVASILLTHPEIEHLEVVGHTDERGDEAFNLDLSARRAKRVVEYLASRGVEAGRLKAVGMGKTQPIASNKTEAGRAQNRRVEFLIKNEAN